MYKTGVITDEISQSVKEVAELAVKYKLDALEIRSAYNKGPHELLPHEISEIKKIAQEFGLKICGISSPFFKCDLDENQIKQHIEILKRCIELAKQLNTNIVRGFSFWNKGNFEQKIDEIASHFEKPIELVKNAGITFALESEENVYASNAANLKKLLDVIASPHVRALWDPANNLLSRDYEVPYPNGYEIIKPYIAHVHIKDVLKNTDGTSYPVALGAGSLDVKGQLSALARDKFEGYVVLETHYRKNGMLDMKQMALPQGEEFSYMGYESTEECLNNWKNI